MNCYFQDIEHQIIDYINKAQTRLLICTAWFTNETIGATIIRKKHIDVEIVIDDNTINRNCKNLEKLKAENFEITFVKDLNKRYYLMHNKFCIIDNLITITGSYNWTKNANTNDENITITKDKKIAAYYTQEFRRIKDIEFPTDNISISHDDTEEITNLIYIKFIAIIKTVIENGESNIGLIANWKDEKILNKLRLMNERVRNTLDREVGEFGIYYNLIGQYGFDFKKRSTEAELVKARDNFKKRDLDKIDFYLNQQFSFFKIKAIRKLHANYSKLMKSAIDDKTKCSKILHIINFLNKEKITILRELNLNVI